MSYNQDEGFSSVITRPTDLAQLLQDAHRPRGDGGTEERHTDPRHTQERRSVPKHQVGRHLGRRGAEVPPSREYLFLLCVAASADSRAFARPQSSVKNVFIRGSVVRYVHLPASAVDVPLLEDATRRGKHSNSLLPARASTIRR